MTNAPDTPEDDLGAAVPPQCRATVDAIQRALEGDGDLPADAHLPACAACRERVRAARVLLSVLAVPSAPVAVPAEFTARVMNDVWGAWHDRRQQTARRVWAFAALAAAVLIAGAAVIAFYRPKPDEVVFTDPRDLPMLPAPVPAPTPAPKPEAPAPRPVRVGDALASTGQAILDAPKPLADSVAVAPKVFDALADSFKLPEPADPMAEALEPARRSLDALPVAARSGLEPVTGTAEKAFNRFLRDVGAVKPNS